MTKTFYVKRSAVDKDGNPHIVLVYGELVEKYERNGVIVDNVTMSKDGRFVKSFLPGGKFIDSNPKSHEKKRSFNMGWAICHEKDKFDLETGIKICKGRFSDEPLETRSKNYLTKDMVSAIIINEASYICDNIERFLTMFKKDTNPKNEDNKSDVHELEIDEQKEENGEKEKTSLLFKKGDVISFNVDGYKGIFIGRIKNITSDGEYIFDYYNYYGEDTERYESSTSGLTFKKGSVKNQALFSESELIKGYFEKFLRKK